MNTSATHASVSKKDLKQIHPLKQMQKSSRIYVAGHRGLVGSAILRRLKSEGYENLIFKTHHELDLLNQKQVNDFFAKEKIEYVFLAAARVGGIHANSTYQADFLYENVMIAFNVIHAALEHQTEKLLFLGSSCIYPKLAPQPLEESSLLTASLEPTNEGYALAKIAGLKLCEKIQHQFGRRFISGMPTNMYGPFDNFHPENSHVIPGMMRRFHEAKVAKKPSVLIWGSGTPKREFLHSEDLSRACLHLMLHYESPETINIGTGTELTIRELAESVKKATGFEGSIELDPSKPDGTPRKVMNVDRIHALGWKAEISFQQGLSDAYQWALENKVF